MKDSTKVGIELLRLLISANIYFVKYNRILACDESYSLCIQTDDSQVLGNESFE